MIYNKMLLKYCSHKPSDVLQQVYHGGKHHLMDAEVALTVESLRRLQLSRSRQLPPPKVSGQNLVKMPSFNMIDFHYLMNMSNQAPLNTCIHLTFPGLEDGKFPF